MFAKVIFRKDVDDFYDVDNIWNADNWVSESKLPMVWSNIFIYLVQKAIVKYILFNWSEIWYFIIIVCETAMSGIWLFFQPKIENICISFVHCLFIPQIYWIVKEAMLCSTFDPEFTFEIMRSKMVAIDYMILLKS